MWSTSLGDLITVVCQELAASVEQSSARMAGSGAEVEMRIGDVELDTPVRVRFQGGDRLAVALPGTRERPDGVGRLHLRIETHYG
jgi:hypothetical protein